MDTTWSEITGLMQTVKIVHPTIAGEFIVINAEDFNTQLHEVFDESADKKKKTSKKPAGPPGSVGTLPLLTGTEQTGDETTTD